MADRVRFEIGPVKSDLALGWIDNSRGLVAAVRKHQRCVAIEVRDDMLDLCDVPLDIWSSHAHKNDPFVWGQDTDTDQVRYLVRQWIEIGALTNDELAHLGCTWAPEWTRPFGDALVTGALTVLADMGDEGEKLAARLRRD